MNPHLRTPYIYQYNLSIQRELVRDTTLEVTATRLPPAPLRWGARTVQARRLKLDDGTNQILLWSDARGRLLKLEEPVSGLRVVRDAPAVKPARRRKSASG